MSQTQNWQFIMYLNAARGGMSHTTFDIHTKCWRKFFFEICKWRDRRKHWSQYFMPSNGWYNKMCGLFLKFTNILLPK